MPEQYVIRPDNKSLMAFKGIEEVSFSFPIRPILEEGIISEILVDTKHSVWQITLFLKQLLFPEQAGELERALSGMVLGLSRVKLEIVSPQTLPPLETRLAMHWQKIVTIATDKFAGCNGW
ncbi:MAG TPA: hypothetical protein VEC37_17010, partial [Bacillota bacterium]|nr:hypothetical protein [Bacillota bacterium]